MLMRQKKWDMNKSERTERLPCEYKMFRCQRCTAITEYCLEWLHKCNNYPHTVKEETCVTMWLGSNPGVDAIRGLSLLLVLSLAPRGFSPGAPVFPSPQKPTLPNSHSTRNQVDEEPLRGSATFKPSFVNSFVKFEF